MRISVVTVTFNAAAVLPGLIDSLRAQVDGDFEWVVVDGGSTDGTVELLRNLPGLPLVWRSEPDFGIYDALNKAVKLAQEEYYLVAGADDVLDPMAVANYKALILSSGADIVTAPIQHMGDSGHISGPYGSPWRTGARAYITWHSVGSAYRKSLHDRPGVGFYPQGYPVTADQLFVKRAVLAGAKTAVGDFLAGTVGGDGISSDNVAAGLSDFFRVQLETERNKGLQLGLYIWRLLRNVRKLTQ